MFVLSECVGRGSLTPEVRPGGWKVTAEATALEALWLHSKLWNLGVVGPGGGWGPLLEARCFPGIPKPPHPPDREKGKCHVFSGWSSDVRWEPEGPRRGACRRPALGEGRSQCAGT